MSGSSTPASASGVCADGHQDDTILWARVGSGDAEAFGVLFDRHAKAIYNYCFRRTGDWATAEDLLSIVFLEAWRRRDKALPAGKVLPWFYGIATNVVRNQHRSQRRHAAALGRLASNLAEHHSGDRSDERLDDQQQMREALALISRLPRKEQDVVALCGWSGLTYEEASVALDVPIGTVRSRLSSARRRLNELRRAFGHMESEA